jgi:hypothetical protein
MRTTRFVIVLGAALALAAACTGHYTEMIGSPVDAPNACKGALYDPCTENSQCMSGICRDYVGAGFSACTEACVGPGTNSCPPDSTGSPAKCNNMGECKPVQANVCGS